MSQINESESGRHSFWRSLGQLGDTQDYRNMLHREFQEDASVLEDDMSRRTFLKLLGASLAIAGLSGCNVRRPKQFIHPYVKTPENEVPGKTTYYASAMNLGEEVTGVLIETFEGRPIKLEGNPQHRQSQGALKSYHQASVVDLYDPDRLKGATSGTSSLSSEAVQDRINELLKKYKGSDGKGLAILTETQVSPTYFRLLEEAQKNYSELRVFRYDPVNEDSVRSGVFAASGDHLIPMVDFEQADIVVGFGSDFMGAEWHSIANTKGFSKRRDPDHSRGMNRFYAFESSFSVTGGKADHHVKLAASDLPVALVLVAKALVKKGLVRSDSVQSFVHAVSMPESVNGLELRIIDAILDDVQNFEGRVAFVAGPSLPAAAHALIYALNTELGRQAVGYLEHPFGSHKVAVRSHEESIRDLVASIENKQIETLVIIGGNPVYNAPNDLKFEEKLRTVGTVIALASHENETTKVSSMVIPRSHFLEAWGDAKTVTGTVSVVQPTIEPLYESLSDIEFLSFFGAGFKSGYDLVRETYSTYSESAWKKVLHEGILKEGQDPKSGHAAKSFVALASQIKPSSQGFDLLLSPSYSLYDGRYANNGWLQETPDPVSKLTWDNALYVSPKTAKTLRVDTGDMVTLKGKQGQLDVPVWIAPGQADRTVSLSLGYGRKVVGRVGEEAGFNAFCFFSGSRLVSDIKVTRGSGTYKLATTQEHGSMEGRPLYRQSELEAYKKDPNFAKEMVEHPPLVSSWEEKKYDTGYQWGMSIDLGKCMGCSACLTACQSENNIPIVGKAQVLNAREMHWIRIDRYFEGSTENPQMVQQPVTCLQCEMAPCEQVCPVAATVHSQEGLNEMTYNRCVGTRYCANNCPAKVRRFNFFDFHQRNPQSVEKDRVHLFDYFREPAQTMKMQFNPDVTVRMRGVMEKCTYCVQRINEARHQAGNEEREIRDGEVVTACQQTCPADAIVFGNILDPNSKVAKAKKQARDYHLLAELNLKPRTSYLAGILNPHPILEASDQHLVESRKV